MGVTTESEDLSFEELEEITTTTPADTTSSVQQVLLQARHSVSYMPFVSFTGLAAVTVLVTGTMLGYKIYKYKQMRRRQEIERLRRLGRNPVAERMLAEYLGGNKEEPSPQTSEDIVRESSPELLPESSTTSSLQTSEDIVRESSPELIPESSTTTSLQTSEDIARKSSSEIIIEPPTAISTQTSKDIARESSPELIPKPPRRLGTPQVTNESDDSSDFEEIVAVPDN